MGLRLHMKRNLPKVSSDYKSNCLEMIAHFGHNNFIRREKPLFAIYSTIQGLINEKGGDRLESDIVLWGRQRQKERAGSSSQMVQ